MAMCECGVDHHPAPIEAEAQADAAEAVAEAIVEAAQIEAAADVDRAQEYTEQNADDNDTREAIVETEAAAAVEIAEVQAEAAVAIAEAEAAAAVAIAEAEAAVPIVELEPAGGTGELVDQEEELAGGGEIVAVTVPPQIEEPEPAPAAAGRHVSAFRARRQHARR
jgi:hypothetical protein